MSSGRGEVGPASRRDADGGLQVGSTWESLVERLIREAQERGELDGAARRGQRLEIPDDTPAVAWALAHHVLRTAGIAPRWIETDKDVRRIAARVEELLGLASGVPPPRREALRGRLEVLLADHRRAVHRLEAEAPTARQARPHLDRHAVMARLELAFRDGGRSA